MTRRARQQQMAALGLLVLVTLVGVSVLIGGYVLATMWGAPPGGQMADTLLTVTETRELAVAIATGTLAPTATPSALITGSLTSPIDKTSTRTPTILSATGTPAPSHTMTPRPTLTLLSTLVTPTPTRTPTASPTPTSTAEPPTPTETVPPSPTPSATVVPAQLSGRLVLGGLPANSGTVLALEDSALQTVATQSIDQAGRFSFGGLAPSVDGYQVTFAQAMNEQFDVDQVMSWVWAGPISTSDGAQIDVGDLEIGLLGLDPVQPVPESSIDAVDISPGTPLMFEWMAYPGAESYWLDLVQADGQAIVWKSDLVATNSVAFDGKLDDGTSIAPGDYAWAVGAQRKVGGYGFVVYGYLTGLKIAP